MEKNVSFVNQGNLKFQRIDDKWGLDLEGLSYAAATSDLDQDGDLDLIVVNLEKPVSIYRNDLATGNRVTIALRGNRSNSHGHGATVEIETDRGKQTRTLSPQTGFLSNNEAILQFGLGDDTKISKMIVHWSSGVVQTFEDFGRQLPIHHRGNGRANDSRATRETTDNVRGNRIGF